MRRALVVIAAVMALSFSLAPARADDAKADVQAVVEAQVAALAAGDAEAAFSYATPDIQKRFGSPRNFLAMVQLSYSALIEAELFEVEAVAAEGGHGAVRAHVIGKDGRAFKAIYPLLRQPDGAWRIDGCYLQTTDGRSL
jgi:ketosteroid isomerase-like protein